MNTFHHVFIVTARTAVLLALLSGTLSVAAEKTLPEGGTAVVASDSLADIRPLTQATYGTLTKFEHPADDASIGFHLGFLEQTVKIADFELLSYGTNVDLKTLPRTSFTYPGREMDAPWSNTRLHVVRPKRLLGFLYVLMFLLALSPLDVVFRPGPRTEIKMLPLVQIRDAYQHVRERIEAGERENIDYVIKHSGCSGPTFPRRAIVIFTKSELTSVNGSEATKEESEKYIQNTLEYMKERRELMEKPQETLQTKNPRHHQGKVRNCRMNLQY